MGMENGMASVFRPPFETWANLLFDSFSKRENIENILGKEKVKSIRQEVVSAARSYSKNLFTLAEQSGVEVHDVSEHNPDGSFPIVMSGDQATLFHPGLLLKTQMLSRLSQETGAIGLHVVIDTDAGDGGEISWPKVSGNQLEVKKSYLVEPEPGNVSGHSLKVPSLYQRIRSKSEIIVLFAEIEADLRASGLSHQASHAAHVGRQYAALEKLPIAAAHSIIRWHFEKRFYDEVPFSLLVKETGLSDVIHDLLGESERFSALYNRCLDRYRAEHKIKNLANPFPNLRKSSEGQELPIWRIGKQGRKTVKVKEGGEIKLELGEFLTSKGGISTLLLRAYCSDLFIHGLGGGSYDKFSELFAREFLGVELPPFVVASQTVVLFPEKVKELSKEITLASQLKEMVARTEHFIGKGIFSETEERLLVPLLQTRRELREKLKRDSSLENALNDCNRQVRHLIENGTMESRINRAEENKRELARWSFREFPFFFFKEN